MLERLISPMLRYKVVFDCAETTALRAPVAEKPNSQTELLAANRSVAAIRADLTCPTYLYAQSVSYTAASVAAQRPHRTKPSPQAKIGNIGFNS
jgi:hypothetical protein